jgi:methyl-accepting chemotaxis protein
MSETSGGQQAAIAQLQEKVGETVASISHQSEASERVRTIVGEHKAKIGELIATLGGVINGVNELAGMFPGLAQEAGGYRDGVRAIEGQSEESNTAVNEVFRGSSNPNGEAASGHLYEAYERSIEALHPLGDLQSLVESIALGIGDMSTETEQLQRTFKGVVEVYDELTGAVGASSDGLTSVGEHDAAAIESLEQAKQAY